MRRAYPFPLLDQPTELARHNGWTEEVYSDLLAFQAGRMSRAELDAKYLHRKAILVLDLTGFTVNCFDGGTRTRFCGSWTHRKSASRCCVSTTHG